MEGVEEVHKGRREKVGDLVCRGADWRRTGTEGVGGGGQAAREVSGFARMSSLNSDNVGGFFLGCGWWETKRKGGDDPEQ
mgnify:CR=1 FL=1